MCKDKKLPGIQAYTVAACHDDCKKRYIAEQCKCAAFYMKGKTINFRFYIIIFNITWNGQH